MERIDSYAVNQEAARVAWNSQSDVEACYIQQVEPLYWRVSDNRGSIHGYIDLEQEPPKLVPYGA